MSCMPSVYAHASLRTGSDPADRAADSVPASAPATSSTKELPALADAHHGARARSSRALAERSLQDSEWLIHEEDARLTWNWSGHDPGGMLRAVVQRILIIEDDASLADMLALAFHDAGFDTSVARDGEAGLVAARGEDPALIVLDVGLPHLDGLEVCRRLRAEGSRIPMVMLTSRGDEIDKVLGLELGADDYVTKPFSLRELLARIRSALRRAAMVPEPGTRRAGRLHLDRGRWLARYDEVELSLTTTELGLLWTLVEAEGHVCARDRLIEAVYGAGVVVADRTIDTFIKRIRRKLTEIDGSFTALETVRGVGYRYRS
jgi:two-component system, OmpR family, response regulator